MVIDVKLVDMSVETFEALLKYIYTGSAIDGDLKQELTKLQNRFETLNPVRFDMKNLLQTELFSDVILEFRRESVDVHQVPISNSKSAIFYPVDDVYEVHCHASVLSARSEYFKLLLEQEMAKSTENRVKLRIDESVIPRTYVHIILTCFYSDRVDLTNLNKWRVAEGGGSETDHLQTVTESAMAVYEVGQFLEFPCLVQGKSS